MRSLRAVILIAATVVAFVGVAVVAQDRAQAAGRSILDWNTAGNSPAYGNANPNWLSANLGHQVVAREPTIAVLTLQEVCFDQAHWFYWNYLQYRPGPWSYFAWYNALHSPGACGGHQYGNAVFMIGGGATTSLRFAPQNQTSAQEKRGMACMNGQHGWGVMQIGVCSLHLVPNNVPKADCQVGEAFTHANAWVASGDRIAMSGDYNIQLYTQTVPGERQFRCEGQPLTTTELGKVYAGPYREADEYAGSANQTTAPCCGKIDYVFASTNTYLWYDLLIHGSVSDHYLLTAHVNM